MTIFQHLPVLACIGFALLLSRRAGLVPAVALMLAVSGMILLLFLGALAGQLLAASLLILAAGLVVFLLEAIRMARQRLLPPLSLSVFFVLSLAFWLAHNDATFYYFDAFSHWGIFLREVISSDALWTADTNSVHPKYLPGPTLWQYLFTRFSPALEGGAFHAQFVLLIAPLMLLFEYLRSKPALWLPLIAALLIILLFNFGHGIQSIYVDHVLGTWVAGCVLAFLVLIENRRPWQPVWLAIPIAGIAMIKSVGIFFVAIVCGTILAIGLAAPASARLRRLRATSATVAAVAVLSVGIVAAWGANRGAMGIVSDGTSSDGIVSSLLAGDSMFSESEQAEITRRYVEVLVDQQISKDDVSARFHAFSYPVMQLHEDRFRLTVLTLMLAAGALIVAAAVRIRPTPWSWLAASACLWFGTVAYLILLYLGYVFVSESSNGLVLSSFIRYSHSMILPLLIVAAAILLPVLRREEEADDRRSTQSLAALAGIVVFLLVFETPHLKFLYTTHRSPDIRFAVEPAAFQIRQQIGRAPLHVVVDFEDPNGFLRHMIRYQLTPGATVVELVEPGFFKDLRTYFGNRPEAAFVWVAAGGEQIDRVLEASSSGPSSLRLFRINRENGEPLLAPVGPTGAER